MNELIKEAKNTLRQPIQGVIALSLTLTLCYVIAWQVGDYEGLFANVLTLSLGFYFGRETKTNGGN